MRIIFAWVQIKLVDRSHVCNICKAFPVFTAHCCREGAFILKIITPENLLSLPETKLLASGNQLLEKGLLAVIKPNLPSRESNIH